GRGARIERRDRDIDRAELGLELLGGKACAGPRPEERGKFEHAVLGPERHESDEAAQVLLRVEAVEPGGGEQRVERGGAPGVVIAAAEEPGLPAEGDGLDGALGPIVREHQAAVVEEARERLPLIVRVLERAAGESTPVSKDGALLVPREE